MALLVSRDLGNRSAAQNDNATVIFLKKLLNMSAGNFLKAGGPRPSEPIDALMAFHFLVYCA